MNNHIVLPRVLVDDLTSALEATRHHLNHPDNAGDRLRFATRLMQSANDAELAALDNRETFELAERVAWWRDQAEARLTAPSLRKLADTIKSSGAPERIRARLKQTAAERLADAIDAALRDRGIRHYVDGIEPNHATAGEVVLWPYGRPVASVQAAVEFVTEAARS